MLHCCEMSVSFSGKRCENALKEQTLAYVGCKISQMCQLLAIFWLRIQYETHQKKTTTQAAPLMALIPAVPAAFAVPVPAFPNGPLRWQ